MFWIGLFALLLLVGFFGLRGWVKKHLETLGDEERLERWRQSERSGVQLLLVGLGCTIFFGYLATFPIKWAMFWLLVMILAPIVWQFRDEVLDWVKSVAKGFSWTKVWRMSGPLLALLSFPLIYWLDSFRQLPKFRKTFWYHMELYWGELVHQAREG